MGCLNCKKEIIQTPNKREKKFCNSTCRSNYWQKAKVIAKKPKSPEAIEFERSIAIMEQIVALENEKMPDYIKMREAKIMWNNEQFKKIEELKKQV